MTPRAALLATLLLLPLVAATPSAHTGEQTGRRWSEAALVPVQASTRFVLAGAIGDHDIHFYRADGELAGASVTCGTDTGIVPDTATHALILIWDHVGMVIPRCLTPIDPVPSSRWIYTDGL